MKILWLTIDSLVPLDTAGRLGVYKRMEQLWKDNDIYLFYFYNNEDEKNASQVLNEHCKSVKGYKREKSIVKLLISYIRYPYTVSTRINPEFIKDVEKCIATEDIDIINIDFPQMGYCLLKSGLTKNKKIVVNQHNIEWQRFIQISNSKTISLFKKIFCRIEAQKLKNFEKKLYRKLDISGMTFVTDEDKNYFIKAFPEYSNRVKTIPGGADYCGDNMIYHEGKNIVFVGVMSNELNPEGALWFINEIFPKIKEKISNVKFYVVGKDPIKELTEINDNSIVVTGSVPSVDKYYSIADLIVIPVLHGGGVKLKLLEAIGHGHVVVSTSQGARGTDFINKQEILITDDEDEFSDYCIDILQAPEKYESLRCNAIKKFIANYTWEGIGKEYRLFLDDICFKDETTNSR